MIEQIFKQRTFTTMNGAQVCADPETFVFESRVERYVGIMEAGSIFATHVKKARVRSNRKRDGLVILTQPFLPILSVISDHSNEEIILAITSKVDEYDQLPRWEMKAKDKAGDIIHVSCAPNKAEELFKRCVIQGSAEALRQIELRGVNVIALRK